MYDRWLLDVPKLMDLAAIYGPTNKALVQQLIGQLLALQPQYWGVSNARQPGAQWCRQGGPEWCVAAEG